jgi:hypothetical protein
MGWCRACGDTFLLDRDEEGPWARARTCSDVCRARLGNRGRNSSNCRHCVLVESYRELRESQIRQYEVACADEDLRPITWGKFLEGYRAEPEPAGLCNEADEDWRVWADDEASVSA